MMDYKKRFRELSDDEHLRFSQFFEILLTVDKRINPKRYITELTPRELHDPSSVPLSHLTQSQRPREQLLHYSRSITDAGDKVHEDIITHQKEENCCHCHGKENYDQ